jgi:MFS family permease
VSLQAYGPILRTPGLPALFLAATLARLPIGFETLGIVLLVREVTGSFTVAGVAVGAAFAVSALTAAPLGRLVDRMGQRAVLIPTALWISAATTSVGIAGLLEARGSVLVILAALTGVYPPIAPCQRAIFARVFTGAQRDAIYALEAIIQEAVFVGGPLIAAVAATLAGPPAALFAAAALTLGGTFAFVSTSLSRSWTPTPTEGRRRSALRTPAVRTLVLVSLLAATSFAAFEVAATAFAREQAHPNAAGLLLALWAVGSAVGGVAYGARNHRRGAAERMGRVAVVCAFGFLPAAFAPNLFVIAPLMAVAGLAIAPLVSLIYTKISASAPDAVVTEAFAWLNVAFPIGFGIGAAICGVIVDGPGARVGIAVSGVGALLAALATFYWRGTLAPGRRADWAP